jgi:chitin synthase
VVLIITNFRGESGSGKTQTQYNFICQLQALRSKVKKEVKLYQQILNGETVFESFGHASTVTHNNASRFGKYMELQFDSKGRTIGVKSLDYVLEKHRVTQVPRNESNFFVFYQMLNGMSTEEKAHFQLQEAGHFHYLQGTLTPYNPSELSHQFQNLKKNLKDLGFNRKSQSQIFQVLAAILHLGNVTFANQLGGSQEAAYAKNEEVLNIVADFLGLMPSTLESLLTYKTKLIKKELCTVYLDAAQAVVQRDDLAKVLYSLLFSWIIEYMNIRLCKDNQANFIGLLDLPGFQANPNGNGFEQFCNNYANERLYNYMCYQIFEASNDAYAEDNVSIPIVPYINNQPVTSLLGKSGSGVISILHKQANKPRGPNNDPGMLAALHKHHAGSEYFSANLNMGEFTVRHFAAPVTYNISGFMDRNMDSICTDFVSTFRGDSGIPVGNPFVAGLFTSGAVATESHPQNTQNIVSASVPAMPVRKPSMKRDRNDGTNVIDEKIETTTSKNKVACKATQFQIALDEIFDTFDNTEPWFVICMRANTSNVPDQFDAGTVGDQVDRYSLPNMAQRKEIEYTVCYQHDEFVARYIQVLEPLGIDPNRTPRQICDAVVSIFGWGLEHVAIGSQFAYLSDEVWRDLEDHLRASERESAANNLGGVGDLPKPGFIADDAQSFYSDDDRNADDQSVADLESNADGGDDDLQLTRAENQLKVIEAEEEEEVDEKPPKTTTRKAWVCFTWSLTFWIPSFVLSCCCRMKNRDVRMAWREKLALCFIIFLMCAGMVLFIVGINPLVCPKQHVMQIPEMQELWNKDNNENQLVAAYGRVYKLNKNDRFHPAVVSQAFTRSLPKIFGGNDISELFPQQISTLCNRWDGANIDEALTFQNNSVSPSLKSNFFRYARFHDHRYYLGEGKYAPNYWQDLMKKMDKILKVSDVGYTEKMVSDMGREHDVFIVNGTVYNLDKLTKNSNLRFLRGPDEEGTVTNDLRDKKFLHEQVVQIVQSNRGKDVTPLFEILYKDEPDIRKLTETCLNNAFAIGLVDTRNSFKCRFSTYVLLALSVFIFLILLAKFLASLNFGSKPEPEDHDQFVVCNVPCYTEGEDSLRKTIDSLTALKYDDKRKLLFIVCDGMIVGGGNDFPTPRIVLDILGSDSNLQPEALSFQSLGEGMKQHNMAKVYTGLYEYQAHVVPYIVVVKVGRASERARPGNRGKRDSQLILMRFFNKVHYDYPMTPLELEMYHQIKNVIGVDPHLYEYILMVDADTLVLPDSLNRLISAMVHDTKIMGICGETALENERDSWATMIQVYEYFISHHLAKAFESLFGTVTCLPGCFCMYRIRAPNKNVALLANNCIVNDYSENVVDTLHKKNLLHLGEDRYLTTLMLKHFPFYKMTFTSDAKCLTVAPDTWSILLSQRRRWINSTVHNLLELVFLPRLCGFCCFSMRFVVFMDLLSTVVMPATLFVLGYLFYTLATTSDALPITSICLIVAPYALQVLVFILRRKWEHIGWMIIYILALPVFAFFIPVYSFWHFDDFSWGNTRLVVGEGGKKKKVAAVDEGKFDPKSIPVKKWSEYEEEIWENGSEHSFGSKRSHLTNRTQETLYNNNKDPFQSYKDPTTPPAMSANDLSQMQSGLRYNQNLPQINRPDSRASSRAGSRMGLNQSFVSPGQPLQVPEPRYAQNNQSFQMRPLSHFSEAPSRSASPMFYAPPPPGTGPSDADIQREVKRIVTQADLMNLTKKNVREELSRIFGLDMGYRKDYINYCIDLTLQGQ